MRNVSALLLVVPFVLIVLVISGIAGVAEPAPPVSECDLCLSVSEASPHICRPAGSVIAPDTQQLFARVRLDGPIYEAHEVLVQWFDPIFGLYAENTISIPEPESAGYGWWDWYIAWAWLDIAGDPAAERPGPWRVDAHVDGQLKCSKTFEMDVSSELRETLERETRDALSVGAPTEGGEVTIRIEIGAEAAGFFYVVLYDTELAKGSFFGEGIGLGSHAESLDLEGQLDEQGAATLVIPWPGGALEYYFQVLVAVHETEFAEGRFWQSEPIHQQVPPPEQTPDSRNGKPELDLITAPDGADDLFGMPGNDPLYGCAGESPFVLDECLLMQLAPSALRCDSEQGIRPVLNRSGYATVSGGEGPGAPALCYLSVDLPAVSCCTALQLREFRICYQCLTVDDRMESIEIGYLTDDGSFEVVTTIETDLTSTVWDCVTIALNGAIAPRPLVFRFLLNLGGGGAGGVRFGNMAAALAPQTGQPSLPGRQAPAGVTCGSLCVGTLENVFSSTEQFVWCADGFDLSSPSSEYEVPSPTFLVVAFINNCSQEIRCTRLDILDGQGGTIWSGSGYVALPEAGTPQEWARWDVRGVPEGTYQVVAQTNLGEFRTRIRIMR